MGDFNAKIGKGREEHHVGPHGLGERNDRGETLSMFAAEHNLIVLKPFSNSHLDACIRGSRLEIMVKTIS